MKKILFATLMLLSTYAMALPTAIFTSNVQGGNHVDRYEIVDPDNTTGYDGYVLYFTAGVSEVLIQTSLTDFSTSQENLLCWNDGEVLECPNDEVSPGVYRMPLVNLINDIQVAGNAVWGGSIISVEETELIYLGFWYEFRTKALIDNALILMDVDGLNDNQKRRSLKYVYLGNGVDTVTAEVVANNRIINGVVETYRDFNLTAVPVHDKLLFTFILYDNTIW